jgi:hypothetical protein
MQSYNLLRRPAGAQITPHSTAVGYARISHLSAPRVISTVKRPSPSGVMTSRPRA